MVERKSSVQRGTYQRKSSVKPLTNIAPRGTSLGSDRNSPSLKVAFRPKDRENHTHILGSTGTGKSKLLEYMLRQDIRNPKTGLCLLDPHGSLYDEILHFASHRHPNLADRIVTFNPAQDIDHVVGFNPVATDMSRADYFLPKLISACLKASGQHDIHSSPRITRWLENIFTAIMSSGLTLQETVPLISTAKLDGMRDKIIGHVASDTIRNDWASYNAANLTQRQQIMEGASNRLRNFLRNETLRLILGQQEHKLDFLRIMQEGKILLVNLNGADRIDRENMQLIGTLMVNEIFSAAQLRDPRDRALKPFYFYIDEFAQFVTRDIAYSLEEARKRKLFMILAHQHLAQLKKEDEYLYASVMTNCKNKIVFGGLSVEDSDVMNRELNTGFLDLKSLKHAQYRTRVRHIEETREVRGYSSGTSQAKSETESQSQTNSESQSQSSTIGESFTETHGRSKSLSVGETQTRGTTGSIVTGTVRAVSQSIGSSQTLGKQISRNWSEGQSKSEGENWSNNRTTSQSETSGTSRSISHGSGSNWSESDTTGWSSSETEGNSTQHSHGHSTGQSQSHHDDDRTSTSHSQGSNQGSSHGQSSSVSSGRSGSHSESRGGNQFESVSDGQNQSQTQGQSVGESHGGNRSVALSATQGQGISQSSAEQQSSSDGLSRSYSKSQNKGWSQSVAKSITQTETVSQSMTLGQSSSETTGSSSSQAQTTGTSTGKTETESQSESVSYVPFLRPEEVEELASVSFWTKEELLFLSQGDLKNQDTAQAVIKIGSSAPIQCQIDRVDDVYYHEKTALKRLERFRTRMIEKHPEYFQTIENARSHCIRRQVEFFDEPIKFDGTEDAYRPKSEQSEPPEDDEFFE